MNKRILPLLVSIIALLVPAGPARADHASTLHGIIHCVEGGTTGVCGNGWRGIQADIELFNPILDYGTFESGVSVTSLYIAGPGGVCYDPCQGEFVEFGWFQERHSPFGVHSDLTFFLQIVSNGLEVNCPGWTGLNSYRQSKNSPLGVYRFRIRQTSDAPGNFKFSYRPPGSSNFIAFGCTWTQNWGATAGDALTSTENFFQNDGPWYEDEPGPFHKDVQVQLSTNYTWYDANATTGYPLLHTCPFDSQNGQLFCKDEMLHWNDYRTPGGPGVGDSYNYRPI